MERLVFLVRADNVQTVLTLRAVDAGQAVREGAGFFSALAEDRSVLLHCEGGGAATADLALLRMALRNLVSNALRHTKEYPQRGGIRL